MPLLGGRTAAQKLRLADMCGGPMSHPDTQPRTVEPWGVFSRSGRWYIVGRCRSRDAGRTFRVACMDGVRVLGFPDGAPQFERPVGCRRLGLPIAWNLAGGYQTPIERVLALHTATAQACVAAYR